MMMRGGKTDAGVARISRPRFHVVNLCGGTIRSREGLADIHGAQPRRRSASWSREVVEQFLLDDLAVLVCTPCVGGSWLLPGSSAADIGVGTHVTDAGKRHQG